MDFRSSAMTVNHDSPLPLYFQVKQKMRSEVIQSGMSPGSQIPSEAELKKLFGVSRVTLRRAIDELVREGVLYSRQGMGHFVANPDEVDMQCIRSFTEDAYLAGHKPATKVLSLEELAANSRVAQELGVEEGDTVSRVRRLRLLDGKPTFLSDAHLRSEYAKSLGAEAFKEEGIEQSLYHALKQIPELRVMQGSESTLAVSADAYMAEAFGVSEGHPLVQRACTLLSQSGEPIVFEQATWGVPITRNIQALAPDTFRGNPLSESNAVSLDARGLTQVSAARSLQRK